MITPTLTLSLFLGAFLDPTLFSEPARAQNGKIEVKDILENLPSIDQLPIRRLKSVENTYPKSNELDQRIFIVKLDKPTLLHLETPQTATPSPLVLRIRGPVKGFVLQGEGQPAVGDMNGLIAYIIRDAKTDREKAEALFFFVRDQIKDWWYPAQGSNLAVNDLSVLVWGFGYGYCYDLGRLQSGLWAQAGFRSRIVAWPRHTVAEVFYDDAWHLYDGQHHSYYTKPDGQVASFQELKTDGQLFYQGLNKYGLDIIGYPPHHMVHWYSQAEPEFKESGKGDYWSVERDFRLNLREGEFLDITYTQPGSKYHPDSWVTWHGLKSNHKDPPSPVTGIWEYAPHRILGKGKTMPWRKVKSPRGKPAWALDMKSPYFFTEGMIKIPTGQHLQGWVKAHNETHHLGRLYHGKAHLSRFIAGTNEFTLIVETPEVKTYQEANLHKAEIKAGVNLSHIGLPRLKPGRNQIPLRFEEGKVLFALWYQEHAADLEITDFELRPKNPLEGEDVTLTYTVTNHGSGASQPTSLSVFNNTTSFRSETTRKVGVQTLAPIKPGEHAKVEVYWRASTAMTWYGQNPYVQLMDAWLDLEKDTPDYNRENNRRQDYLLLKREDGSLPELPGYGKLK